MQFRIQHLMLIIAVFAVSLASGIPGTLFLPEPVWQIVSIHQHVGDGGSSLSGHPSVGNANVHRDYIATIQNGQRSQTINLGDTVLIAEHRLQLPDVGSYVEPRTLSDGHHGELPFTPVDAPSRMWSVLGMVISFVCSIVFVFGCAMTRWFVRRQMFLYRERRMIDRASRTVANA